MAPGTEVADIQHGLALVAAAEAVVAAAVAGALLVVKVE